MHNAQRRAVHEMTPEWKRTIVGHAQLVQARQHDLNTSVKLIRLEQTRIALQTQERGQLAKEGPRCDRELIQRQLFECTRGSEIQRRIEPAVQL